MNKCLRIAFCGILILINIQATAQQPGKKTGKEKFDFIEVQTAAGKWQFSLYPHNIIKATLIAAGSDRNEQVSDAVIAKPLNELSFIKTEKEKTFISWGKEVSVAVGNKGVEFLDDKKIVSLISSFYSNENRGFRFSLKREEMIFGTGERSIPLNRRGYKLPLNNAPAYGYSLNAESLNFSVPFIISSEHYAIFFDNPSKGFLDIGKADPAVLEYSVTSGMLSFYLIPGENYEDIMERFHGLVGTAPLPPRWAMGNLMSRFGYRDEKQARDIIMQMKKDSVPFDAIIFDLFWFGDSIKNTLGNLSWVNKTAWPAPEKMISDFKKENIKTILITEPFVLKTSLNYKEAENFLATDSAGNAYTLQEFYFGKGGIIDIFRKDAQQWFYKKYKTQMDIGVAGWWGDLGEPENHPANVYHNLKDLGFDRKFASGEIHNIYGHYWSEMLAKNFRKDHPGERLFHLNRSGYAGSPRYSSFPWSGDVSRSWDGLKGQLPLIQGMSISGIPYIHSDAGGFAGGNADAELYIRWLQFAVFTPIYRPHGTALGALEPNAKDIPSEAALWPEPTKSLARNAARMRYQWLPYNYNLAYLQATSGRPLITPMFFLDNADKNLYDAVDQYMWGDEIMVVPITDSGQSVKRFYLPEGRWTDVNTSKAFTGPRWVTDSTISIKNIPVLAKEGSFIPLAEPMQNTTAYNTKKLLVKYFPSGKGSIYSLYEDDGEDANAISSKKFEITTFKSSGISKHTVITIESDGGRYPGQPGSRNIVLIIPDLAHKPTAVKINGTALRVNDVWNNSERALYLPVVFTHKKITAAISFN